MRGRALGPVIKEGRRKKTQAANVDLLFIQIPLATNWHILFHVVTRNEVTL